MSSPVRKEYPAAPLDERYAERKHDHFLPWFLLFMMSMLYTTMALDDKVERRLQKLESAEQHTP
jgi:hypothetical protein